MIKSIKIMKVRFEMLMNFLKIKLKDSPVFISFFFIVPLISYILIEVMIPREMSLYALNPNIAELINSYGTLSHQLIYYTLLFTAPIYFFIAQINRRSFFKYSNLHVTFQVISYANIFLLLFFLNIVLVFIFVLILLHTSSNCISSLIFIVMLLFTINIVMFILHLIYQIVSAIVMKKISLPNTLMYEVVLVILITSLLLYPVKHIPFSVVMSLPSELLFLSLILIAVIVVWIYNKMIISSKYIFRQSAKEHKIMKLKSTNINCVTNYVIMLFNKRKIYLEYLFTLILILVLFVLFNKFSIGNKILIQMMIPMFLISNGILYSYKPWYDLKSNGIFQSMVRIDFVFSSILLFISSSFLTYMLEDKKQIITIIICMLTYFVINFLQSRMKLEYKEDNITPLIFIIVYGVLTFILFSLFDWVNHYV